MAQGAMCALCERWACLDSSSVALCVELARGGGDRNSLALSEATRSHQFWELMLIFIGEPRYVFCKGSMQLGREVSLSIRGLIPPKEASLSTHTHPPTHKNRHLSTKVPSSQAKMSNSAVFPIRYLNAQHAPSALSCHT